MLASLLVSQATTHILIENDQVTAFPLTNKWQCLATLAEDSRAGKRGATAGAGQNTLRTHTWAHTRMLQPWIVLPSSSAPSRMLLLAPGSCFPLSQLWFHLLPTHLASECELQVSATRTGQSFPSPPPLLWKVILDDQAIPVLGGPEVWQHPRLRPPRSRACTEQQMKSSLSQLFHLDPTTNYCFQLPPVYSFPCNLLM